MVTIVECPHDNIEWAVTCSGNGHSSGSGQCERCGLFICEEDGRYYLYNGREINLSFGE